MFKLLELGLLVAVTSALWIGEEYWSTIGYDGELKEGRTTADFVTFDDSESGSVNNGWIAYWITRSKYGDKHYEAFGHAFLRDDRRVCGWFVGLEKEVVEVCGGFRVLSRSNKNPAERPPFKWVLSRNANQWNTVGYHGHRVGKFENLKGQRFYGDAQLARPNSGIENNFQGVNPWDTEQGIVNIDNSMEFYSRVWLLLKTESDVPQERTGSRDPSPYLTYEERLAAHNRMLEEQRRRQAEEKRRQERERIEQEHANARNNTEVHYAAGQDGHPANHVRSPVDMRDHVGNNGPFIVTADGSAYDITVLRSDPRLKDPRSHPDDPRYDERFDPRSHNYDGRYNPYDDNFDPTTDPRFRTKYPDYVYIPRVAQYQRNDQQSKYSDARNNDQYDRYNGRGQMKIRRPIEPESARSDIAPAPAQRQYRPAADNEQTAPSAPNGKLHMVRILRPGEVQGVRVVDNDGTVYIKRIENGKEVYYSDPHSRIPVRGPLHYNNTQHVPEIGQGSVPHGSTNGNGVNAHHRIGNGVQPVIIAGNNNGAIPHAPTSTVPRNGSIGNGAEPETNGTDEDENSEIEADYIGRERVAPPKPADSIDSAELHEDPEDEEEDVPERRL